MNVGDYKIQLLLSNKQFGQALKSSLTMLKSFNKQGRELVKLKPVKLNFGKIDAEVKKTEASLRKFQKAEGDVSSAATKTSGSLRTQTTATRTLSRESNTLSDRLGKIGLGLMAVREFSDIASSSFRGLYDSFMGVTKTALEIGAVRKSFESLAKKEGLEVNSFLADLKKNTANAVSELLIMKTVAKGKFLGVDMKSMPILLKFATIRAKEMGVETDYLVDSIVTGLGRKSPLILDNLGLTMKELNAAVIEVAKSHGHLIEKVDDETRAMYLTEAAVKVANEQLKNSAITLDDNAFAFERNTAKIENMRAEIGEQLQPVMLNLLSTLRDLLGWFTKLSPASQKWAFIIGTVTIALGKLTTALLISKAAFTGFGTASTKAADQSVGAFARIKTAGLGAMSVLTLKIAAVAAALYTLYLMYQKFQDIEKQREVNEYYKDKEWKMVAPGEEGYIDEKTGKPLKHTMQFGPKGMIYDQKQKKFVEQKKEEKKVDEDISKILDDINKKTGSRSSQTKKIQETEKKIVSLLEQEKTKLSELQKQYDANTDSQLAQYEIKLKIEETQKRINALEGIHIAVQEKDLDNLENALDTYKQIKDLSLTPEQEASRMQWVQELEEANIENRRRDIIGSEQFQAANFMLNELGSTLKSSLTKAWKDSFGEANSLVAQFIRNSISKLIEGLVNVAVGSILNSIFPGAGLIVGSIFGGGGASPGIGGMPSGGSGGSGSTSFRSPSFGTLGSYSGMLPSMVAKHAPGALVDPSIMQGKTPINLNITANVPIDMIMDEGMEGYNLRANQTKVK